MRFVNLLPLLIGLASSFGAMMFAHRIIKLPSEPLWSPLANIYENYAFAIALGLSLPYPYVSGAIILLLIAGIGFLISRGILRRLNRS
jgi:hypothetical protein